MFIGVDNEYGQLFSAEEVLGKKRKKSIDSPYIHRLQKRHFIFYNILPIIGTIIAVSLLFYVPITWAEITVFFIMWLLTGIGVTAGYHRLFAHRCYKTTTGVRVMLGILGSMSGMGSVLSWAAMHRRHHERADRPGDMHSPNLHGNSLWERICGFCYAHISWMIKHEYPNVSHYAEDLLKDKPLVKVSRMYHYWVILGLIIPTVLGGLLTQSWMGALLGFLWGGPVRLFVVANSMWTLNSILHTFGWRPFPMKENSRNSFLLGVFVWGEGWHNNHHAFPNSASFSLRWYRPDIGYWFISTLKLIGLATDVRVPSRDRIEKRMKSQPKEKFELQPKKPFIY
jgi:stearoyl-CoA desaturase (delta-9 desaturase)